MGLLHHLLRLFVFNYYLCHVPIVKPAAAFFQSCLKLFQFLSGLRIRFFGTAISTTAISVNGGIA